MKYSWMFLAGFTLAFALVATGCGKGSPVKRIRATAQAPAPFAEPDEQFAIWGRDERKPLKNFKYPFSTIGKLEMPFGCTGTLVGPRHVLTATHCLSWTDKGELIAGDFYPAYNKGSQMRAEIVDAVVLRDDIQASIWDGASWFEPEWKPEYFAFDMTVLILDIEVGHHYGWMGTAAFSPRSRKKPVFTNVGYPGDKGDGEVPYYSEGCTVTEFERKSALGVVSGQLKSKCDTYYGHSGGPLFTHSTVMGVLSGHVNQKRDWLPGRWDNTNYFAGGPALVTLVSEALAMTGHSNLIRANGTAGKKGTPFLFSQLSP